MRFHCNARARKIMAMATAAVPLLVGKFALGQTYNTTVTPIYTVGTPYLTLTDGASPSTTTTTPTTVASLIEGDNAVIVGYVKNSGTTAEQVYYLTPNSTSPVTPTLIGLSDTGHLLSTSSSSPQVVDVSSTGLFVGNQTRLDSTGNTTTQLGQDVITSKNASSPTMLTPVPLPTLILEPGTAYYSYTNATASQAQYTMSTSVGTDSSSGFATNAIGTGGIIAGTVNRYAGDANNVGTFGSAAPLGTDGFYYNPSNNSSTAIGLSGPGYDQTPNAFYGITNTALTVHGNSVVGLAGISAVGFTNRYNSSGGALGYDSWMYNPNVSSQSLQIGLTGGAYTVTLNGNTFEQTQVNRTNSLGQVTGKSYLPQSTGNLATNVAFLYTPSSTPGTASTFGTSSVGTYTQLGPTSNFSGGTLGYFNVNPASSTATQSNSNIAFLNNQGHAAGTTNRYDANGNFEGAAAWYYDGTVNTDISPLDTVVHQAVSGGLTYSSNTITAINNKGLVAGFATRVAGTGSGATALGQDAYIYDSTTKQEYFVDPTDESKGTGNYELSYIGALGDNGVAIGYYNTYSGTSSTVLSSTIFAWGGVNGGTLEPLITYTGSAAQASSYLPSFVASFEFGSDGTLYGPNTYGTGATSIVAYSVSVPEPTSLGLLAIGSLGLLRRRRRVV